MSQFGCATIITSIIAAWLRSEIAICFEAVTKWLLRRSFMQSFKPSIEAVASPTLRFLGAALLQILWFIALYVYVVHVFATRLSKLHAFCFMSASFGFIVSFGLIMIQIFNHFIPSEFGLACLQNGDTIVTVVFFSVAPPNLYLMWRENEFQAA